MADVVIRGAREHNLDDVSLTLPRNRLICFTGVSGSGKSSLAFDTLYAEGQRRYVESLSSYARQFLGQLPKPDVERVSGLSPAISIAQKAAGQNVRSTVGTVAEVSDFLRVLFARVATGFCPKCGRPIVSQTRAQILERLKVVPKGARLQILAPLVRNQKGSAADLFANLRRKGFRRVRVDGRILSLDDEIALDRRLRHSVDVVVDRLVQSETIYRRLAEALDLALQLGKGRAVALIDTSDAGSVATDGTLDAAESGDGGKAENVDELDAPPTFVDDWPTSAGTNEREDGETDDAAAFDGLDAAPNVVEKSNVETEIYFSADYACSHCGISFERPTPQLFSFNSPQGRCPHCQGLGVVHTFDPKLLIPDETKSFQQGCVVPIGKWKDMGRWRRHIYQGVADALEKLYNLEKNYVLETAWEELDERVKKALLWGTGDLRVTFSWRNGAVERKWGGAFEGIIPKMLKQFRETRNKMMLAAMERFMSSVPCAFCGGKRLNEQASAFRIETKSDAATFAEKKSLTLPELSDLPISDLREFFSELNLDESGQIVAQDLVKEIRARLGFLIDVGLGYLSLGRSAPTLSGGEMQRIRLAGQIGGGLVGVLYVLDEPSIGLH
ncbi:MAG: excinuclease ABC subunit A, partial [Thermoguttaceae bacterium]|nr:excinuclease ABC subunit A [Thermoguttaceae bacterium]